MIQFTKHYSTNLLCCQPSPALCYSAAPPTYFSEGELVCQLLPVSTGHWPVSNNGCQHWSLACQCHWMSAMVSAVYCQHTGQYCILSALVNTVYCQYWSVLYIVSIGQYCILSALVSTVYYQHWSILYIVSTGQNCILSSLVSTVYCQHWSVL